MTVLTDYRQHDRLHVGKGEDMLEDAARAYLHDRLNGKDTLLMTGTGPRREGRSRSSGSAPGLSSCGVAQRAPLTGMAKPCRQFGRRRQFRADAR